MFKKIILISLILFSALNLYSQEYFRSNSSGMALEKLRTAGRPDNYEYILELSEKGDSLYRILYKEGQLHKKWIRDYSFSGELIKESYYEGRKKTETFYVNNHITEEKYFTDGRLIETDKYRYSSEGRISSIEKYSSSGLLISSKQYNDDKSVTVNNSGEKTGPGRKIVSKYSFSGKDIRSEWQGNSSDTGLFFYYRDGRTVYSEKWTDGRLVSRTDYIYTGSDLTETRETVFSEDRLVIKEYDEKRRVLKETEKKGGRIVFTVYNTYSTENIVKKIKKSDFGTEKYVYQYGEDELSGELYYLNGSIMKKTVYQEGDGNYYEDLYSGNIRYMRIYYRDNEKYKTEQ